MAEADPEGSLNPFSKPKAQYHLLVIVATPGGLPHALSKLCTAVMLAVRNTEGLKTLTEPQKPLFDDKNRLEKTLFLSRPVQRYRSQDGRVWVRNANAMFADRARARAGPGAGYARLDQS